MDAITYALAKKYTDQTIVGGDGTLPAKVNKHEQMLSDQEQQTATLQHGLQVIESDQASPLKVEFYGNTLVNLLGKVGNCEDVSEWTAGASTLQLDTVNKKYGNNSIQVTSTASSGGFASRSKKFNVDNSAYYIAVADIKSPEVDVALRILKGSTLVDAKGSVYKKSSDFQMHYVKISPTDLGTDTEIYFYLRGVSTAIGQNFNHDGVRLFRISKEVHDKIGVSLQDADVERMFPYVSSVQSVKNPVISIEGDNLFDGNVTNHGQTGNVKYEQGILTYKRTNPNSFSGGKFSFNTVIGQPYTLSFKNLSSAYPRAMALDSNNNEIARSSNNLLSFVATATITNIIFSEGTYNQSEIKLAEIMINVGSTAKPFVPRNPSYLYAETVLAGLPNSDKKDILSFNEDKRRWEKTKWWEHLTLDGSLNWQFHLDSNAYKIAKLPKLENALGLTTSNSIVAKYDGKVLNGGSGTITEVGSDYYRQLSGDTNFYITISDTDTGWTDAMTPSAEMIKAYFNGWKYKGDGTTHSWVSIVDGTTAPTEQTLAFVANPANKPTGYKNYFLSYQLAESVIEPVTVEGDLSIQGDSMVEVGELVQIREKANFIMHTNGMYYLNRDMSSGNSFLSYKTDKIITVYKNGVEETKVFIETYVSDLGNGKAYSAIKTEDFDETAEYTVTYIAKNDGISANLTEVNATYQSSIKSSIYSMVSKQSDIATDQSILKRQMLDVLVRLDALEEGN